MRSSLFLLLAWLAACSSPQDQAASSSAAAPAPVAAAPSASAAAATPQAPAPGDSVLFLDVRTEEEYRAGHVVGSVLIPYDQMERRWQEIEQYRDRPIVVYCRSGRRSGIALEVLRSKGFTRATNGGGLEQMRQLGLPITADQ